METLNGPYFVDCRLQIEVADEYRILVEYHVDWLTEIHTNLLGLVDYLPTLPIHDVQVEGIGEAVMGEHCNVGQIDQLE